MYEIRRIWTIGLLLSLSILPSGSIYAQQVESSSQGSSASIDRQKSDEARTPLNGSSFGYTLNKIINSWELTVDAAGLHTLLNQNQKTYTLFKPDFRSIDQKYKLFDIKNQADLQRVLKCHVVPQKILLKDIPNDKKVTFQTMEPGCTITMRAKHRMARVTKQVGVARGTIDCNYHISTGRTCTTGVTGVSTVYTGETYSETDLVVNNVDPGPISRNIFSTNTVGKSANGNYIEFDVTHYVMAPRDLAKKYSL
jgi:uncharacterized surface protein with fasciclin (FAS1) repeats